MRSDTTPRAPSRVPAQPAPSAARRVALNAASPFAAQVITKLMMLGYLIAQYRLLGGGALGNYIIAANLFLYTGTVSDWGLSTLLTREAAKGHGTQGEHERVSALFRQALALRWLISLALLVPVLLFVSLYVALFGLSFDGAAAAVLLTLSLLPGSYSGAVTSLLYAYERMALPAAIGIGTAALNVALGVAALLLGWGVLGLAGAAAASTLLTAAVFRAVARRDFPWLQASGGGSISLRPDRPDAARLLRAGWPLMLNALLVGLFFRVDQYIILPFRGSFAVEQYAAPYSFLGFVLLITPAVTLALFPRMSRHAATDRPRLALEYRFALKLLLTLSVPIMSLTVWFAPLLITIVTGGKPGYLPDSAVALQVLIFFLPLSFVNGVTQYVLIALDLQRLITRAFAATVLFNVAANLVLVPALGIAGAALTTVLSEFVLLLPFMRWVGREVGRVGLAGLMVRPLLAGLVLSAVGWVLSPLAAGWNRGAGALAFYLVVGALLVVVYAGALLLTRPFTHDEVGVLKKALRIRRA